MTRRQGRQLAKANPQGRVDVMLYRIVERKFAEFERKHGLVGVQEHFLPIIERLIVKHVPAGRVIPQEASALVRFLEANRDRRAPC